MRELSLNILDIVENSVRAGATLIKVSVIAKDGFLTIEIADDGKGMSEEFLRSVTDPFTTTRTTRKVGMGIPLFKMAAETANGSFDIKSKLGAGTTVTAKFEIDHGHLSTLLSCGNGSDGTFRRHARLCLDVFRGRPFVFVRYPRP